MKILKICYEENGLLVCYCGKCEAESYPLPKDFGSLMANTRITYPLGFGATEAFGGWKGPWK